MTKLDWEKAKGWQKRVALPGMLPPPRPGVFTSKWTGTICARCKQTIHKGQVIKYDFMDAIVHCRCPRKPRRRG